MTTADPVETVPPPEQIRYLLAQTTRQKELLKSLLRVALRKQHYPQPTPPNPVAIGVASQEGATR